MKNVFIAFFVIVLISIVQLISCNSNKPSTEKLKTLLTNQVNELEAFVTDSLQPLSTNSADKKQLITAFNTLRKKYKTFEWAVEYYMPAIARFVNGPPLPEVEYPEVVVLEPHGLQVIEEIILEDSIDSKTLNAECVLLKSYCISIKDNINASGFTQTQLYDALKMQVFKIIVSDITGFETPGLQTGINESIASLQSLKQIIPFLNGESNLTKKINEAINYLNANNNFEKFNRIVFIKDFANPITKTLVQQQKTAGVPFIRKAGLLKNNASSLFDENVFDPYFQTSNSVDEKLPLKINLGKKLFYDKVLSKNKERSCATCHNPELYFTDGLAKNVSLSNKQDLKRNTPTLLNSALQTALFYDLKAPSLESQANEVINSKDEMHGDFDIAIKNLNADSSYTSAFKNAYSSNTISKNNILNAITDYVKSLVYLNSRFDEYMRGNNKAMNADEIAGFNLFAGKAKCATCHFIPLFNGVVPPAYHKTEGEVLGVPKLADNKTLDDDIGRYGFINVSPYMNAFKTVTLRNIAQTAPYMHNGVYKTLEEVMNFYNNGGGAGMGIKVDNQTLSSDSLNLSKQEINQVISFLNTLTDKKVY